MPGIVYRTGDLFEAGTQVIVNPVNCRGVMGKGLALAFRQRYPKMYEAYLRDCQSRKLHPGCPTLYTESEPWILQFPTKDHWRDPSKIDDLQQGLEYFAASFKGAGIRSIAFPKLGCGEGGLLWSEVGPMMAHYLGTLDLEVIVYIDESDEMFRGSGETRSEYCMVNQGDVSFPDALRSIVPMRQGGPGVPERLYCKGDVALLQTPCVAIVGTRHPTQAASAAAFRIAAAFAQEGFTVVSGLAEGIDKEAHLGALSVSGKTIAVLGTPLFQCYPRAHAELMAAIARRGLLITEYRDRVYDPLRFVDRDRLQAGLSLVVIPVQTKASTPGEKKRPGTLYAVSAALAYGRLVMVPTPRQDDYQLHPDLYAGLMKLLAEGKAIQLSTGNFSQMVDRLKTLYAQSQGNTVQSDP
jgi:DNA protecting protein DprA